MLRPGETDFPEALRMHHDTAAAILGSHQEESSGGLHA
jgi:hypothetical protein